MDNKKPVNPNNKKPDKKKIPPYLWFYMALIAGILILQFSSFTGSTETITWPKLKKMVQKGEVRKIVVVNKEFAEIYLTPEAYNSPKYTDLKEIKHIPEHGPHFIYYISSPEVFYQQLEDAQKNIPEDKRIYPESITRKNSWGDILNWGMFILAIVFFWMIFSRMGGGSGGVFSMGKSRAKLVDSSEIKVTFKDVAGLDEAKEEVIEIVNFLKSPDKYTRLGGKIPKGVLLIGPPGTGKTLLARAVAGEAKVPFFSLSGSDFVEMFVGVGASRVRDLFAQAKAKAPCIVFIDEIDAIGRSRSTRVSFSSNDERENTLNQLLTEMDGFEPNQGVIVMAATNRPEILDKALLRAGRFDRQIFLELPNIKEREQIFKVHTRNLKLDPNIDLNFLARQTPGFSGADIANVCNEAALIAARKNKTQIEVDDFVDAIDKIVGGLEKKNKLIHKEEKKRVAYHEAGHATVSWMLEHAQPLIKVSIVPRGRALGAAWYLPNERQLVTESQFNDEICAILGGRAAELFTFHEISSGALDDLEKATKRAYSMVAYFGMSEKLPNLSFYDSTGQGEYSFQKPYSEKTAEVIDDEVKRIINEQFERAISILRENKDKFVELAELLLKKEVIFTDDVEKILGKRKFEDEHEQLLKEVVEVRKKGEMSDKPDEVVIKQPEQKDDNTGENESPEENNDKPDNTNIA